MWLSDQDKESIENFDDNTSSRMPVWKLKEDVGR